MDTMLPPLNGNATTNDQEAQRGKAQPKMNWPQKNTKDHKENKQSKFLSMRSLRSFAAKILPKMKSFF
jgi:hypothetical protein